MKKGIHPKYYHDCVITCSCGNEFKTGSTQETIKVDICDKCHPFYTGEMKFVDRQGRVDKFKQRMKRAKQKQAEAQKRMASKNKKKSKKQSDQDKSYKDILRQQKIKNISKSKKKSSSQDDSKKTKADDKKKKKAKKKSKK